MYTAPGKDLRRSIALILAVSTLSGSIALPLPAFAFSSQSMQPAAPPAAGKPVEQALEAPGKSIPMPDPLVNNQSGGTSGGAATPGNAAAKAEMIFDIGKAPEPVRKLREAIVEAAASGDLERLRPLMNVGPNQTQVSADDPSEDPIKALHDLSGDPDGIEVLSILLDVLSTGFAHVGAGTPEEMYVWPYFAEKDIKTLTAPEKVDLMRLVTAGDYADMLEFGGYSFYRVGITPDGKWKFFSPGE